jgi:hypothetical protein
MDAAPPTAVVVSGGVAHDFPATSAELVRVLGEAGIAATVTDDVEAALTGLRRSGPPPLLVLNLLRWTMQVQRYAHLRGQWSISLSAAARDALTGHVRDSGAPPALNPALIRVVDSAHWRYQLGGVWRSDSAFHPPLSGPVDVRVVPDGHPIVAGVPDFRIADEVYGFLDRTEDVTGLLFSPHGGTDHPLLWARSVGSGRVVYDALGHHVPSYQVPEHRLIVRRAALWALGASDDQVADGSLG